MARRYGSFTPARRAALRRAQLASAAKRKGRGKRPIPTVGHRPTPAQAQQLLTHYRSAVGAGPYKGKNPVGALKRHGIDYHPHGSGVYLPKLHAATAGARNPAPVVRPAVNRNKAQYRKAIRTAKSSRTGYRRANPGRAGNREYNAAINRARVQHLGKPSRSQRKQNAIRYTKAAGRGVGYTAATGAYVGALNYMIAPDWKRQNYRNIAKASGRKAVNSVRVTPHNTRQAYRRAKTRSTFNPYTRARTKRQFNRFIKSQRKKR
jgi:hypothetical protein